MLRRPCDTEAIQRIADTYNLKVIYDAAHAFGVNGPGGSVLNHGDLSVLSFHATKVFNTFEGGAIISPDAKTKKRIDHLKNFGFVDETCGGGAGHQRQDERVQRGAGPAAAGARRRRAFAGRAKVDAGCTARALAGIAGHATAGQATRQRATNHSYFPILVRPGFPHESG